MHRAKLFELLRILVHVLFVQALVRGKEHAFGFLQARVLPFTAAEIHLALL